MTTQLHGVISHPGERRPTDYLFRISLKCLIRNDAGEVLVVKEDGREWWDLPGGGMDHGEDIKTAIAREMKEEVNLTGDFTYKVITVDDPALLDELGFWQIRVIFEVKPQNMAFTAGEDGDDIAFRHPEDFKDSAPKIERRIYDYAAELL